MGLGVRVIRGPDWDHGNDDGGNGNLGTVVHISRENLKCTVQWDVGTVTECRCEGDSGKCDLRVVYNKQAGVIFNGWKCNTCKKQDIPGFIWKCCACDDFDMCMSCYMSDKHDRSHILVRFNTTLSTCVACPARKRSKKIKLFGIDEGAEVQLHNPIGKSQDSQNVTGTVLKLIDTDKSYSGAVKVLWKNGEQKIHNLGANGKSELVILKSHQIGLIYPDHLPVADLSIPIESLINVGDKVRVDLNIDIFKDLNKDYGGWNEEMENIQGEEGIVHQSDGNRLIVFYRVTKRVWSIFRGACTKISVVEKGDVVKIISDISVMKRMQMNHGGWLDELKSVTGKMGRVVEVDEYGTLFVKFPRKGQYYLNPSCCVKQYNETLSSNENSDEDEDDSDKVSTDSEESKIAEAVLNPKDGDQADSEGMVFDIGIRVVRGPNWKWNDQDGGEGHLGTVVDIGHSGSSSGTPNMCAVVQWDNGYRNTYRIGHDNQFDLKIYDTAALGIKHGKQCTECEDPEPEIFGFMWKCEQCPDVNLCTSCYHGDKHDIMHRFLRFDYQSHTGESIPKRQICSQIRLHGMMEGARVIRGPSWTWQKQDGGDGKTGVVIAVVNFSVETDRDAAEVTWDSGHTNVYRLGYKGDVDLKCIEHASRGKYYRDHLPTFKLQEGSKIGPSQQERESEAADYIEEDNDGRLKKGDTVMIGVELDVLQQVQKEAGAWHESICEVIGVQGIVAAVERQMIYVDFAGKKLPFHEMTLTKVEQFNTNQVVLLSNNRDSVKEMQNGHGPWREEFVKFLGKKGLVVSVDSYGDVEVQFGTQKIKFNPDCLKPTEESPDEFPEEKPKPMIQAVKKDNDSIEEVITGTHLEPNKLNGEQILEDLPNFSRTLPVKSTVKTAVPGDKGFSLSVSGTKSKAGQVERIESTENLHITFSKALEDGDARLIQQVLSAAPQMINEMVKEMLPLQFACESENCDRDVILALLEYRADVNAVTKNANPCLLAAVTRKNSEIVELLLKQGAEKDVCNSHGQTAVHIAIQNQDLKTLTILEKYGCDFNMKDQLNDSPVTDAITTGDKDIIDLVFDWNGIDLTFKNKLEFTPIHLAARKNEKHALRKILQKEPGCLNSQKADGYAPLHLASCMDHFEIAEILLSKPDIYIEVKTKEDEQTPLHLACMYGSSKTVNCLIKAGANVNALDKHDNNALHLCLEGKPSIMKSDTMQKASGMKEDDQESIDMRCEILALLIEHGTDTNQTNINKLLPLDIKCPEKLKEVVENKIKERSSPSVRLKVKVVDCMSCEDAVGDFELKPCGCKICGDCGGKRCKCCPNCGETVNDRVSLPAKNVKCQSCQEEPPDFILQPCRCSICAECGGRRCKNCPNCQSKVTKRDMVQQK